jgi:hypothetical protein
MKGTVICVSHSFFREELAHIFLLLDGDPDDDLIKLDLLLSTDLEIDSKRGRDLRFKFFFPGGSCEFKSSCSFLGFGFGMVGLILVDGNLFSNSDESGSFGVHITGSLSLLRFEDLETDCFSIRDGFLVPLWRYRWRDLDFRWVSVMLPFFFDGISQSLPLKCGSKLQTPHKCRSCYAHQP